jgi:REP element-mobilizing transposase RayT
MYYRRKLPHYHPDLNEANFLFLTWRLAGSIPAARRPLPPLATPASAGRTFLAFDREADRAAFGPVWLQDARVAALVADALRYGETERHFDLLPAWVIMPNHVHAVLQPKTPLPVITRWLKGSTARKANLILGRTGTAFWQDESFDHRVRDEAELDRIIRYIEQNPVSAGLVANAQEWLWSSARLAGESACPTMPNVEAPVAGESACPTIPETRRGM